MKILAVTNMYPSAEFPSQGVFVREQIKGLRAAGLDVRVLFANRRREGPKVYFQWLHNEIRREVAEFGPDVIHAMYGGVLADRIARFHRVRPLVVSFRGSDLLGENLSGWARKIISYYGVLCSRRAARLADGVVVVARHLTNALNGAAAGGKIRVIPSGIDLERFQPMDSAACKQQLGWDSRSFHVLFASNNDDAVKRPALAKAAVAQMTNQSGPVEFHTMTRISTTEVPLWLNAADALLLTSLHEGSPNIIKEALACGLPVISVDVGDVAERIEGIEGCHLAQAIPAKLAAKLELVRQRGGRVNCRARLEECSLPSIAQKLKWFYREVAGASQTGASRASIDCTSVPVSSIKRQETAFTRKLNPLSHHPMPTTEVACHKPSNHRSLNRQ